MILRRAEEKDIEKVHQIGFDSFNNPWSMDSIEKEIKENELAHYIVIEDNGEILGFGAMWLIMDQAHIINIAIKGPYRGKGLSEFLLHAMIDHAKSNGMKSITLEVSEKNIIAQNLYNKFGFEKEGTRKDYYGPDNSAFIYWKYF